MRSFPFKRLAGALAGGFCFSAGLFVCWWRYDVAGLLAMIVGLQLLFGNSLALAFWLERASRSESDESGPFAG